MFFCQKDRLQAWPLENAQVVLRCLGSVYLEWDPSIWLTVTSKYLQDQTCNGSYLVSYFYLLICKYFNGRDCLLRIEVETCYNIHFILFLWQCPGFILQSHFPPTSPSCGLVGMTTTSATRMVDIRQRLGDSGHLTHKKTLVGWRTTDISFWTFACAIIKEKNSAY